MKTEQLEFLWHQRVGVSLVMLLVLVLSICPAEANQDVRLMMASHAVVGKVENLTTEDRVFQEDGVVTDYFATIRIIEVDIGDNIKIGENISLRWSSVIRDPSGPPKPCGGGVTFDFVRISDLLRLHLVLRNDEYRVLGRSDALQRIEL